MDLERLLQQLAEADQGARQARAPARLKARIYTTLIERLSETGPLLDLRATKAGGGGLCVFETTLLPLGEASSMNPCRICHARLMAERLERAPIFWPHCPYSDFHRGKA